MARRFFIIHIIHPKTQNKPAYSCSSASRYSNVIARPALGGSWQSQNAKMGHFTYYNRKLQEMQLDSVLVVQDMGQLDVLAVVDAGTPDSRRLKSLC